MLYYSSIFQLRSIINIFATRVIPGRRGAFLKERLELPQIPKAFGVRKGDRIIETKQMKIHETLRVISLLCGIFMHIYTTNRRLISEKNV